jgi:hypothetical protein
VISGNVQVGIRKMLMLVWSKEGGIKEAVIEAYNSLYISSMKDPGKIAKNLIK